MQMTLIYKKPSNLLNCHEDVRKGMSQNFPTASELRRFFIQRASGQLTTAGNTLIDTTSASYKPTSKNTNCPFKM